MSSEPHRIFIVDDDASIGDSLRVLLEAAGFENVATYASAHDFLARSGAVAGDCPLERGPAGAWTGLERA